MNRKLTLSLALAVAAVGCSHAKKSPMEKRVEQARASKQDCANNWTAKCGLGKALEEAK